MKKLFLIAAILIASVSVSFAEEPSDTAALTATGSSSFFTVSGTELDQITMITIDGGKWSWSAFGTWTGTAAAATAGAGFVGGYVVGSTAGQTGALIAGATVGGAGFVAGAVVGAAAYSLFGWW